MNNKKPSESAILSFTESNGALPVVMAGKMLYYPLALVAGIVFAIVERSQGVGWQSIWVMVSTVVILLVALSERLMPRYREWNTSRGDVPTDLMHNLVSNFVVPELLALFLFPVLISYGVRIHEFIGVSLWPKNLSLVLQLIPAFLIGDLGQYWAHRLAHENQFLWRFHSVHHSALRLYWLNGGRDHPLEIVYNMLGGIGPLLLLGAGNDVIQLHALSAMIMGFLQHSNIDLRLGFLNYIISGPELHRWHHSPVIAESNHNYGAQLIIWDLLFRTRFLPRSLPPIETGIEEMPLFPQSYAGQLIAPFAFKRYFQ